MTRLALLVLILTAPVQAAPTEPVLISGPRHRTELKEAPPGWRMVRRPSFPLLAAGLGALMTVQSTQLGILMHSSFHPEYLIPVAGPIFFGAPFLESSFVPNAEKPTWMFVGAALDVVGIGLVIASLVFPSRWLEPATAAAPRVALVPGPGGLSVVGGF